MEEPIKGEGGTKGNIKKNRIYRKSPATTGWKSGPSLQRSRTQIDVVMAKSGQGNGKRRSKTNLYDNGDLERL